MLCAQQAVHVMLKALKCAIAQGGAKGDVNNRLMELTDLVTPLTLTLFPNPNPYWLLEFTELLIPDLLLGLGFEGLVF